MSENSETVAAPAPERGAGSGAGERVYFEHLDGLRFWAFFVVLVLHNTSWIKPPWSQQEGFYRVLQASQVGNLGVNFFFVLSGFLITHLLIAEHARTGRIDVRAFYIRRALRIWPLYFACVAVAYLLHRGASEMRLPPVGYYLSFTPNVAAMRNLLLPAAEQYELGTLGVLWSVGVEEQFYVVWPLIMGAVLAHAGARGWRASPAAVFAGIVALSLGARLAWAWAYHVRYGAPGGTATLWPWASYYDTLCVIGDMALGGWAAWACAHDPRLKLRLESLSRAAIVASYAVLLVLLLAHVRFYYSIWGQALLRLPLAVAFAFVIVEQCYARRSFYKCGRSRLLSRLGVYTYGLYCLHPFSVGMVAGPLHQLGWDQHVWQLLALQIPLSLAASLALAVSSYHFFEAPFLRFKRRFAHVPTT